MSENSYYRDLRDRAMERLKVNYARAKTMSIPNTIPVIMTSPCECELCGTRGKAMTIPDPTPAVRTFSIPPAPVDPAMFDRMLKALLRAYEQIDDCPFGECPSCQNILETIHEAQRYKGDR